MKCIVAEKKYTHVDKQQQGTQTFSLLPRPSSQPWHCQNLKASLPPEHYLKNGYEINQEIFNNHKMISLPLFKWENNDFSSSDRSPSLAILCRFFDIENLLTSFKYHSKVASFGARWPFTNGGSVVKMADEVDLKNNEGEVSFSV